MFLLFSVICFWFYIAIWTDKKHKYNQRQKYLNEHRDWRSELCDGVSFFLPRPLGLFLRRRFPASLSEHWRSNTYSLRHTNGNQLGGNCSIWPLSCLHHIPSSLCPYIIRTWTVKMNQRQSIHFIHLASPPAPKLNKTPVIYFIGPDKTGVAGQVQTGRRGQRECGQREQKQEKRTVN